MAAAVHARQIEGTTLSIEGVRVRATESWLVEGVTAGAGAGRLAAALKAPGMPQWGSLHPELGLLWALDFFPEFVQDDPQIVRVNITWRVPNDDELLGVNFVRKSSSTAIVEKETSCDVDGNPIWVDYTDCVTIDGVGYEPAQAPRILAKLSAPLVTQILRAERYERDPDAGIINFGPIFFPNPQEVHPIDLGRAIVGRVNSTTFRGEPARTWLLTHHESDSQNQIDFLCGYEFTHNPDGWDQDAVYIIAETGEPGPLINSVCGVSAPSPGPPGCGNLPADNGIRRNIRVHGEFDFHELGLGL